VADSVYAGINAEATRYFVVPLSVDDQMHNDDAVTAARGMAEISVNIDPLAPAVSNSTEFVTVVELSTPFGVSATAVVVTQDATCGVCAKGAVNVFAIFKSF
jgi:hypothetical protein